jgi:phosphatidylglycerol---prolipoprotein diacylglyceryl transferase
MKYPEIDPIAFSIGPIMGFSKDIHWYGLMYLFTFLICWAICLYRTRQPWSPLKKDQVEDLIFYIAVGVILGGRLGYGLFYGMAQWSQDVLWILKLWTGGMSFHGGLIGVLFAIWCYGRKINQSTFDIVDWGIACVPIGLFLGRIGNFIGQELWGRATEMPWGIVFPYDASQLSRHPSQLYEAFFEGIILFLILFLFSMKKRPRYAMSGMFLVGYGVFRAGIEFFREPDSHIMFDMFGWMTRGQILCVPMILVGSWLLWYSYRSNRT